MTISTNITSHNSNLACVQLDSRESLEAITTAFDCYLNPALPEEAILDTSFIDDNDESREKAIEIFGEENWNNISGGMVLFHS